MSAMDTLVRREVEVRAEVRKAIERKRLLELEEQSSKSAYEFLGGDLHRSALEATRLRRQHAEEDVVALQRELDAVGQRIQMLCAMQQQQPVPPPPYNAGP